MTVARPSAEATAPTHWWIGGGDVLVGEAGNDTLDGNRGNGRFVEPDCDGRFWGAQVAVNWRGGGRNPPIRPMSGKGRLSYGRMWRLGASGIRWHPLGKRTRLYTPLGQEVGCSQVVHDLLTGMQAPRIGRAHCHWFSQGGEAVEERLTRPGRPDG